MFSGVAQGGINFAPGALALKFDRFNPVSKWARSSLPSASAICEVAAAVGAILWLAVNSIRASWETMVHASSLGLRVFAGLVGSMVFSLTWKAGLVLLLGPSSITYSF